MLFTATRIERHSLFLTNLLLFSFPWESLFPTSGTEDVPVNQFISFFPSQCRRAHIYFVWKVCIIVLYITASVRFFLQLISGLATDWFDPINFMWREKRKGPLNDCRWFLFFVNRVYKRLTCVWESVFSDIYNTHYWQQHL